LQVLCSIFLYLFSNILLSILFWNVMNLRPSFKARNQT
jgi:hypothetical protein